MIAEGWGLAFAAFRLRPRDAFDRVMRDGVSVAEIFEQRRQRREPVPDRRIAPRLAPPCYSRSQIVAPGDDMRARHGPKFLRPHDAGEAHEVLHGVFIGPARVCVGQVGEPLDLGRHVGQPVKLVRRQHARSTGGGNPGGKLVVHLCRTARHSISTSKVATASQALAACWEIAASEFVSRKNFEPLHHGRQSCAVGNGGI